MTCCVGIEHEGRVWLAADAASTSENGTQELVIESKVWRTTAGWGFAFAGSWRVGELLKAELRPPRTLKRKLDRYVKVDLVRVIRSLLHGEDEEDVKSSELLVATRGALYTLFPSTGQSTRSLWGYAAIGTPDALVGLALTERLRDPERRLQRVLAAVSRHVSDVRPLPDGRFHCVSV